MAGERRAGPGGVLEAVRLRAVDRLDAYLTRPDEQWLKIHQLGAMHKWRASLARGETAGSFIHPPGAGKSPLIAAMVEALGVKTVLISPTIQIANQNAAEMRRFTPDLQVATHHTDIKEDLSSRVVNTVAPSARDLVRRRAIRPDEVGLVVYDEVHTALGEQQHQLHREFPNAILVGLTGAEYFDQLEGYKSRGIVKEDERWTGMFTNIIDRIPLEEGQERGMLVHGDVVRFETKVSAKEVRVPSKGDYRDKDLRRTLDLVGRNEMIIAMLTGLENVPAQVHFTEEQEELLREIYEKMRGERTFVFGLDIDHIEKLAQEIRDRGVVAKAVHSDLPQWKREEILAEHDRGETPVVLGVDMLGIGVNSPKTRNGILARPSRSGLIILEQWGRLLRLDEEDPDKRAYAVQLIDQWADPLNRPVLISDLYDPEYILEGTQHGEEPSDRSGATRPRREPVVFFKGMSIDTIIDQAKTEELLVKQLEGKSINEMDSILAGRVAQISQEGNFTDALGLYQRIAEALHERKNAQMQRTALEAIQSGTDVVEGKRVFTLLNMRTVISALLPYLSQDANENNDLVQEALTNVYARCGRLEPGPNVTSYVHQFAEQAILQYLARKEGRQAGVPRTWVEEGKYPIVRDAVTSALDHSGERFTDNEITDLASSLAEQTGLRYNTLRRYITYRSGHIGEPTPSEARLFATAELRADLQPILKALSKTLRKRHIDMFLLRYGLAKPHPGLSLEKVADLYEIDHQRLRDSGLYHSLITAEDMELTLAEIGSLYGVTSEYVRASTGHVVGELKYRSKADTLLSYIIDPE